MPNAKISALPPATSVLTTDEFPINQGGTTKKVTLEQIQNFIKTERLPSATSLFTTDEYSINQGGTNKKVTLEQIQNFIRTESFRNRIINGDMRINQRKGTASISVPVNTNTYCVDRFYMSCTGSAVSGQSIQGPIENTYRYKITGTASNTSVNFGTRLESINTADMAGKKAALQIKASSSSITNLKWTVYTATSADTFGTFSAPTRILIQDGIFNISSTEDTYYAVLDISNTATNGLEIVFSCNNLLQNQTLTIGDIQLEKKSSSSEFEYRPYPIELMMCQRYFEKGSHYQSAIGIAGTTPATNEMWTLYKVTKRISSSITFISRSVSSGANVASLVYGWGNTDGFNVLWAPNTSNADAAPYFAYYASAEL